MRRRLLLVPVLMLLAFFAMADEVEMVIYSTGFESSEGFTAKTSYNNTTVNYEGPVGARWGVYHGTPSTTGAIDGSQSMQMRWYTGSPDNLGYTFTDFNLAKVTKVIFKAANTYGLSVVASYSTDGGTTYLGEETFALTGSAADYTYNISSTGEYANVRIKFQVALPDPVPTETSRLYIDDVRVYGMESGEPSPPVARAGNDRTVLFGAAVTLDGSESSDPNADIVSYQWTQIAGTSVTLNNADSSVASFTAPDNETVLSFELLVTDATSLTDKDTVSITVIEPVVTPLFFSEYIEGSSNNKAYEIYNSSSDPVDLSDYTVKLSRDGAGWGLYAPGDPRSALVFPLSGTLGPNEVYVVANAQADPAILSQADTTFAYSTTNPAAYTVCFTGNDALGLFYNDILVDVIGVPTENPGSTGGWAVAGVANATYDNTIIRKLSISTGNTDWAASAGTNADNSEWIVMGKDYFDNIGFHGVQAYIFTNMQLNTDFPRAGSEIGVTIDITPGDEIPVPATVKIYYGTGGTLANSTDMWLESGNTWAGTIPSLSSGNLVLEYYVEARKDANEGQSQTYSTLIAGAITPISDIHANLSSVTGEIKTLEGVITIGSNLITTTYTSAYMQDASGRGLNIYRAGTPVIGDLVRGTKIRIVGEIELYNSTVEITGFKYQILASDEDLPAPQAVTVAGANSDNLEGTLATVTGEVARIDTFTTSKNIVLSDGSNETVIKVYNSTGIDLGVVSVGTEYAFTGVGSKFNTEHQLLVAYQTDISDEVSICDRDMLPASFALNPAYPNPFNPATTIEYSLDQAGSYELSVYNLTGQRVAVLAGGYAEPGYYKQTWNAGTFTSGIYFIRLEAAGRLATRKVVLIK